MLNFNFANHKNARESFCSKLTFYPVVVPIYRQALNASARHGKIKFTLLYESKCRKGGVRSNVATLKRGVITRLEFVQNILKKKIATKSMIVINI